MFEVPLQRQSALAVSLLIKRALYKNLFPAYLFGGNLKLNPLMVAGTCNFHNASKHSVSWRTRLTPHVRWTICCMDNEYNKSKIHGTYHAYSIDTTHMSSKVIYPGFPSNLDPYVTHDGGAGWSVFAKNVLINRWPP